MTRIPKPRPDTPMPAPPPPDGGVRVVLVHPATWPDGVRNPAKTQLTVPRAVAEAWDAAGVAIGIGE